jgi:CheY-like chemotaxis protein
MNRKKNVLLLVVEDNDARMQVFERWLKVKGGVLSCTVRLVWAKSAGAAIGLLERDPGSVYAGIMLDYDLDEQKVTHWGGLYNGRDVVKKIIEVVDKTTLMLVHSSNTIGGPRMHRELEGAGFCTELAPFQYLRVTRWIDWLVAVCDQSQN